MAKKKTQPTLEALMSDPDQVQRMQDHLYSRQPLLEQGGPFAQMLQRMASVKPSNT